MVGEPDATMQPAPQDNQLMSKHRALSFKPYLRLERRGQDGQNETEQPDHSASLGDSITSSTRIRFSVRTGGNRYVLPNATAPHLDSTNQRRTRCEQMSSGFPLKADIAQCSRHVSKVPLPDHAPQQTASLIDHLVGAGEHQFVTFFRVGRRAVIILTELTIGRRSNELAAFPLAQRL